MRDQKHSNCSWTSSAYLGLYAALAIKIAEKEEKEIELTDTIKSGMKNFNHYTRY
jgi:hypothetical protein